MPHMSKPGVSSKHSTAAMPFRIVFATDEPIVTAPRNSKTAARHTAWRTVSALAPTEVAYAFATSEQLTPEFQQEKEKERLEKAQRLAAAHRAAKKARRAARPPG